MAVEQGSGQYLQNLFGNSLIASLFRDSSQAALIVAVLAGVLIPLLLTLAIRNRNDKKVKERAVTVNTGGEPGIIKRNKRYLALLGTPREGATNLAKIIFERACVEYASKPFLGTRNLVKVESVKSKDGRSFEKLTLGEYVWTLNNHFSVHVTLVEDSLQLVIKKANGWQFLRKLERSG